MMAKALEGFWVATNPADRSRLCMRRAIVFLYGEPGLRLGAKHDEALPALPRKCIVLGIFSEAVAVAPTGCRSIFIMGFETVHRSWMSLLFRSLWPDAMLCRESVIVTHVTLPYMPSV